MSVYLARFTLTPATWARLIEKPEDRRQALEPVIAAAGGELHGFWYAFGDADGYALAEFPSDVVAASTLAKVAASGAFASVSTTKLLTVEEMLEALHDAGGMAYRGPGAAG
jgi:uncharacterized protein with GYD domain